MTPHAKCRLLGLIVLIAGVGGSAYIWHSVLTTGIYWPKASFIFPVFACFGLSLIAYPSSKAESLAKYGSEQMPWRHIPAGQKLLIFAGVLLGGLQTTFFSGYL